MMMSREAAREPLTLIEVSDYHEVSYGSTVGE